MITRFQHKGLESFFQTGRKAGIQSKHAGRLRLILSRLDASTSADDMALPGHNLHPLKGQRKSIWSVTVSGNWRITFKFTRNDADIVNYEDHH